jgi:hypothetical protein
MLLSVAIARAVPPATKVSMGTAREPDFPTYNGQLEILFRYMCYTGGHLLIERCELVSIIAMNQGTTHTS